MPKNTTKNEAILPSARINQKIYFVRGTRVMLDSDLAELYGVTTSNLNLSVRRNMDRFPDDFVFRLNKYDLKSLILQFAISKTKGRGGRRFAPYAFTEQGIAMLSSVLRSQRAVQVNVAIMRAFVRMREMVSSHERIAAQN